MKRTLFWTIGKGGLLGRYLDRETSIQLKNAEPWSHGPQRFHWEDDDRLRAELCDATWAFTRELARGYDSWIVLWSAGAGVVGTAAGQLEKRD